SVRVIDASTAHRVAPGWDYGFPELSEKRRAAIAQSKRVANPGCHATGFLAAAAPLVTMEILPWYAQVTCFSLTGYSGGGKKMIAEYEAEARDRTLDAPRVYGLSLHHKHLPEMTKIAGLDHAPVFCPVVADYYKGMATTIMLQNRTLAGAPGAQDIHARLAEYYAGQKVVSVAPFCGETPMLAGNELAGSDALRLVICGHEEQTTITALFDNLGKGASGAAVQNMNIMLGWEETAGLSL
ncbi:MAG: N-acetyl-gamma-glutamyl-phosphate reductase, partial [Intestinibacillus sp.]